jgi:hypothetical protein
MKTGMLWFDNSEQRDLEAKLEKAAAYYESKYGSRPTVCYVHPSFLTTKSKQVAGLDVRTSNTVLPHHFWIGISR